MVHASHAFNHVYNFTFTQGGAVRITFRIVCSVCAGVFVRVRSHGRLFGRLIALVLHRDWNGHRRRAEKPVGHPAESSEQPADEIRELFEGLGFSDVDLARDGVASCARKRSWRDSWPPGYA